jgi:hypothetical protein
MPPGWFEATIPEFERVTTVHALDRAASVINKQLTNTLVNVDVQA